VIKVAILTLRGLEALHNWKPQIVHRDLKSRNILVEADWQTKLCDFGESRYTTVRLYLDQPKLLSLINRCHPPTLQGTNLETLCKVRGTYAYIAPEVYFGQSFTPKSDVYAFGVILWEIANRCVKGSYESPFSEFKSLIYDFQIIVQASRKGLRPTVHKDVPAALSNMIRRCWDHEPSNRPDATSILRFFEEIQIEPNPKKWVDVKHAVAFPPVGGAGVAGNPPKSG
jgi:serine/threonine protein kinase